MFGDIDSAASLAEVVVSLLGLSLAMPQLVKLRGETRAAREAAKSARRAIREIRIDHPPLSPEQQTQISRSISAVSNME